MRNVRKGAFVPWIECFLEALNTTQLRLDNFGYFASVRTCLEMFLPCEVNKITEHPLFMLKNHVLSVAYLGWNWPSQTCLLKFRMPHRLHSTQNCHTTKVQLQSCERMVLASHVCCAPCKDVRSWSWLRQWCDRPVAHACQVPPNNAGSKRLNCTASLHVDWAYLGFSWHHSHMCITMPEIPHWVWNASFRAKQSTDASWSLPFPNLVCTFRRFLSAIRWGSKCPEMEKMLSFHVMCTRTNSLSVASHTLFTIELWCNQSMDWIGNDLAWFLKKPENSRKLSCSW